MYCWQFQSKETTSMKMKRSTNRVTAGSARVAASSRFCFASSTRGVADDLEPSLVRIIHKEEGNAIVYSQVAGGEQLAVAFIIGEGKQSRINGPKEAAGAAAMLNVRPAVLAQSREIRAKRKNAFAFLIGHRQSSSRSPRFCPSERRRQDYKPAPPCIIPPSENTVVAVM